MRERDLLLVENFLRLDVVEPVHRASHPSNGPSAIIDRLGPRVHARGSRRRGGVEGRIDHIGDGLGHSLFPLTMRADSRAGGAARNDRLTRGPAGDTKGLLTLMRNGIMRSSTILNRIIPDR